MRSGVRALVLAGVLLTGGMRAAAQTSRLPDTARTGSFSLDTLRVEVTRTPTPLRLLPMAASAVQRADITTARPGVGLDEVLGHVPGVHVANRENLALGARITLRGFGARSAFGVRGVRLLADGVPLTTADGQGSLNNLDLVRAGRVEVLRGPASALYGNAAGGVIRLTHLLGLERALPWLVQGRRVSLRTGLSEGLVDALAREPAELLAAAKDWIRRNPGPVQPFDRHGRCFGAHRLSPQDRAALQMAPAWLRKLAGPDNRAAGRIADVAVQSLYLPWESVSRIETRGFVELLMTPEAQGRIADFFARKPASRQ